MQYWWVNQNQTFRQERAGGYIWSPKRKSNNHRNPFYEFMREVMPGDLVLSFVDTRIPAVGIAQSYCYECPKPAEFGTAGPKWDRIGWKVDVRYVDLMNRITPSEHMDAIGPNLPALYAPLRANGHGKESVYLTRVPDGLMQVLARLIGRELLDLMQQVKIADGMNLPAQGLVEWEEHLERGIADNPGIAETERTQLIIARRGQGKFRENVQMLESACRVTKVQNPEHLRASHIKPWRDAGNDERLDGENGFLLTPTIDHLFDRGFITFEDTGKLVLSRVADVDAIGKMGITTQAVFNVGGFSSGQKKYLDYHREHVFLQAATR